MGRTSDANIRLMNAALELMWEESYGAVSVDDICQRADVKKGSFYHFFKSKAELAVAAMERLWENECKPDLDRTFSPSVEPLKRLTNYLKSIYDEQVETKQKHGKVLGCPICSLGSEISTQEIDVTAKVREIFSRERRYFESAIRDAVAEGAIEPCDPVEKASAMIALIDGLTSQSRIMNDPEVVRHLDSMAMGLLNVKHPAKPASV